MFMHTSILLCTCFLTYMSFSMTLCWIWIISTIFWNMKNRAQWYIQQVHSMQLGIILVWFWPLRWIIMSTVTVTVTIHTAKIRTTIEATITILGRLDVTSKGKIYHACCNKQHKHRKGTLNEHASCTILLKAFKFISGVFFNYYWWINKTSKEKIKSLVYMKLLDYYKQWGK